MPRNPQPGLPNSPLTDRELQVLAYQSTALTQASISRELDMSPRILQRHLTAINRKFTTDPGGVTGETCADDYSWPFA